MMPSGIEKNRISTLHVGKYYPPFMGGIETFMADLLTAQVEDNLTVAAVVHDHRPRLRGEVSTVPLDSSPGDKTQESRKPIRLYRAPTFGRLIYAPVSPLFPLWLRRAIRTERPDILHLHLPNTSAFWALFLPAARRIPWVVHWHSDVVSTDLDRGLKLAYSLYRPFEQRLLRRARKVIVTSPNYLKGSNALMPWHDKCCAIPLGLDRRRIPTVSRKVRDQADKSWGDAGFRILSIGRLTYYKGHEHLIRAMKDLPGAHCLIVGDGDRSSALTSLVADLNLQDRITLTGELDAESLHGAMATCNCFCLPSIERTEAFGMVLIEAMTHGKPSVVCDIPGSGVSWVIQDGTTGLAVEPKNPDALSGALRSLWKDRQTLDLMGQESYKRYRSTFGINRANDAIRRVYQELVDQ